ncbi:unnamed protein product [Hermetia illucens]|uniref:Uncharacterized protein n=1 Tax=Hermetia illucens TaxID=343691 RepID=A0A7R8YMB5_HERIL|nr:unnamed protein product [Hermetia illucens]
MLRHFTSRQETFCQRFVECERDLRFTVYLGGKIKRFLVLSVCDKLVYTSSEARVGAKLLPRSCIYPKELWIKTCYRNQPTS